MTAGAPFSCRASAHPAAPPRVSTSGARKEVGVTVYTGGFGLVREVRDAAVGTGHVALELRDVASQIQPETVAIKSLSGARLDVLEQNYRFDLLTPQKLLEKYVGRKVRLYRYSELSGKEESFDADVLSVSGNQTVYKINGEITYDFPGRVAFPDVPANLIAKPTLVWLLDSGADQQKVEVTYLTRGMNWHCDYVLVVNDADTAADLTAWVTLENKSGTTYDNAHLKLVAGDVQRVQAAEAAQYAVPPAPAALSRAAALQFREEGLFEYHLYTLNRPTTLLDNENKQVTLVEASGVRVAKKLIFLGQSYYYRSQLGMASDNQKVGVYFDVENREGNRLGIPLPRGVVRVYKADKSGGRQFIGEDQIDHTPRDEKLRVKMGEAFDVVGSRKQVSWNALGSCSSETEWEISLRNHKDTEEEVEDVEPIGGDWEIVSESQPHVKKDAFSFTYTVSVPARGEVKIRYRARVRWC
jgi:hypothetical protein